MAGVWSEAKSPLSPAADVATTFALLSPEPKFDLPGTFELLAKEQAAAPRATPRRQAETDGLGFTWSSYRLASLEVAPSIPKPDETARANRPRYRLASLTPMDGTNANTESDDERYAGRTAIYDISAKILYMPNGDELEAHSGFGDMMDDPNYVQHRMRGATPPNTYNLRLRESLFHGVQAVRMLPVNEKEMFGRTGILVHPFMLGPTGQSNGCISLRDYEKFLKAYQRGEVARIVVVPHKQQPPTLASRLFNLL